MALKYNSRDQWIEVIQEEFKKIFDNNTWYRNYNTRPLAGAEVLPPGFILRIKRNSKGEITR